VTRTLDAVWFIAGIDPFGFRLSHNWSGGDFTCTIVNQMLLLGEVLGPFWGHMPKDICAPTDRRSYPRIASEFRGEEAMAEIVERRVQGLRRATDLVERQCDELLIDRITEMAMLDTDQGNLVRNAVKRRLKKLFHRRLTEAGSLTSFEQMLDGRLGAVPSAIGDERVVAETDKDSVSWKPWLEAYRDVLDRLAPEIGLQGDSFTIESKIHVDRAQSRKIGETPSLWKETSMSERGPRLQTGGFAREVRPWDWLSRSLCVRNGLIHRVGPLHSSTASPRI
jgi:hypothetical protein